MNFIRHTEQGARRLIKTCASRVFYEEKLYEGGLLEIKETKLGWSRRKYCVLQGC